MNYPVKRKKTQPPAILLPLTLTDPDPPVVEIKDVSESVATDIADEIIQHWKLDEISDDTYLQHTEDWDSLWHVYYIPPAQEIANPLLFSNPIIPCP